jgi:hypothetical protein
MNVQMQSSRMKLTSIPPTSLVSQNVEKVSGAAIVEYVSGSRRVSAWSSTWVDHEFFGAIDDYLHLKTSCKDQPKIRDTIHLSSSTLARLSMPCML